MCNSCKYDSCAIYKDDHRHSSIWFEEWVEEWHGNYYSNPNYYGVDPLFDPLEAHMADQEDLVKELSDKGIDISYCQFLDPEKGCLISKEKRPIQCQQEALICKSVYESLETEHLTLLERIKWKTRDHSSFSYEKNGIKSTIETLILFPKMNISISYSGETEGLEEEAERVKHQLEKSLKKIPTLRLRMITNGYSFELIRNNFPSRRFR